MGGFPMSEDPVEILLVEDNINDVTLALHAFKKHKVANHIHVARDGAEALDFLFCTGAYSHRQFDSGPRIILLDLKLPRVDGLEVLRRIKSDARTRMIPVVILTSSAEECDIAEGYLLGVNSYMVKPVDFDRFSESVRQLGFYWLLLNRAPMLGSSRNDPVGSPLPGVSTSSDPLR
jgi:two-component system response regulator